MFAEHLTEVSSPRLLRSRALQRRPQMVPSIVGLCSAIVCSAFLYWPTGSLAEPADGISAQPDFPGVFVQFTAHIARQVELDKQQFVAAEACTHWFYQQLKPKRPNTQAQPTAQGTEMASDDCRAKYPQGINGARDEMSRTQSALSLSLTFYEFALVGDRDDDGLYSDLELHDILEAFGFGGEALLPDLLLATLNNKFDAIRKFGGLEPLMTSMGTLYDKGYRFTTQDREALDRIMG
jgi:hypothetical protein